MATLTHVQKDTMKPDSDAVNPDGTLKDTDQMDWLNSPTDVVPFSLAKHGQSDEGTDEATSANPDFLWVAMECYIAWVP